VKKRLPNGSCYPKRGRTPATFPRFAARRSRATIRRPGTTRAPASLVTRRATGQSACRRHTVYCRRALRTTPRFATMRCVLRLPEGGLRESQWQGRVHEQRRLRVQRVSRRRARYTNNTDAGRTRVEHRRSSAGSFWLRSLGGSSPIRERAVVDRDDIRTDGHYRGVHTRAKRTLHVPHRSRRRTARFIQGQVSKRARGDLTTCSGAAEKGFAPRPFGLAGKPS